MKYEIQEFQTHHFWEKLGDAPLYVTLNKPDLSDGLLVGPLPIKAAKESKPSVMSLKFGLCEIKV